MSDSTTGLEAGLRLPSLSISGFRGISRLDLSGLRRVTLVVGRNGAGKSTILESVRIYAARGRYSVLEDLLECRRKPSRRTEVLQDKPTSLNSSTLFHGWDLRQQSSFTIGRIGGSRLLRIEVTAPTDDEMNRVSQYRWNLLEAEDIRRLRVKFGDQPAENAWIHLAKHRRSNGLHGHRIWSDSSPFRREAILQQIECLNLGPGLIDHASLTEWWDNIALTEDEERCLHALRAVMGQGIQRVAVIGHGARRRVVVKIEKVANPVRLQSLGDGAVRLFGTRLALSNSPGGFLTIDEAETSLHHSVFCDYWRMIIDTAKENNVQVIATTQSWDCIRGFAEACNESKSDDSVLFRIENSNGTVRAIEYPSDQLLVASEQRIEVR